MLRVDGGMRTGRDVLVAAALGGDEFGFGTVAMIATGKPPLQRCLCRVGVGAPGYQSAWRRSSSGPTSHVRTKASSQPLPPQLILDLAKGGPAAAAARRQHLLPGFISPVTPRAACSS